LCHAIRDAMGGEFDKLHRMLKSGELLYDALANAKHVDTYLFTLYNN
jgi:hypothetical protein